MVDQKTLNFIVLVSFFINIINCSEDKNYLLRQKETTYSSKIDTSNNDSNTQPLTNTETNNTESLINLANLEVPEAKNLDSLHKYNEPIISRSFKEDFLSIEDKKQKKNDEIKNIAFITLGFDLETEWSWSNIEKQYAFLMGDTNAIPPNPNLSINSFEDISKYTQAYLKLREFFKK